MKENRNAKIIFENNGKNYCRYLEKTKEKERRENLGRKKQFK